MADGGASPTTDRVLLVVIVPEPAGFDQLVTLLLDVGVAATVVESRGLMSLIREEMPIFSGLASMLPQTTGTRVVLSVAKRSLAGKVLEAIREDFPATERPIGVTLPIDEIVGAKN